jgi:hypothetical protein
MIVVTGQGPESSITLSVWIGRDKHGNTAAYVIVIVLGPPSPGTFRNPGRVLLEGMGADRPLH